MYFSLFALRLTFLARDRISFPAGASHNILRGTFGSILKRVACPPTCLTARNCEVRDTCPYARIFEPYAAPGTSPSGLSDPPRPFVFRAGHLDGRQIERGETFHFDLHIFDTRNPNLHYYTLAFAQLAEQGLGPLRGRAELQPAELPLPISLSLLPGSEPAPRVKVRFLTPTELKHGNELATRPEFGTLFARVRDRLSTLSQFYGAGPLAIDHREMGARANGICMTSCTIRQIEAERRSGRTGQTHSLGGFTGEAEYAGELREFLPYLRAAKWTGVGRQTVWGKGEIETELRE